MASSSSPFQINGLGSGVDTASILDTLRTYRMRPATLEQNKQKLYAAKKQAWLDVNVRLLAVQTAAQTLSSASAFSGARAASSDETVASVSATGSAAPGSVSVSVTQLAQARKVASAAVTGIASSSAALGWSGAFTVNGKTVSVAASDSLDGVAGKINALAGANAQAAVIQTAPGTWKMTLAGTQTGRQDALSLADVNGGNVLGSRLGILSATGELRYASGAANDVASSVAFASATDSLATLTGLPAGTGTFTLGAAGPAVAYDTATDTLSTLAAKITSAGAGQNISASVVSDTATGKQRLQISGVSGASFSADANGLMDALGVTQKQVAPGQQLFAAQDATFTLDGGLVITRPTNTVSDVLAGVTISLKKTSTAPATLTINKDTQAAADLVNNLVKAYNDLSGKIKAQNAFAVGGTTPPLLGDFTLQRVQEQLANALTGTVAGQPAGFSSLRDVGVKLADDGTLGVDSAALNAALIKNADAVSRLFTQWGQTDDAAVSYLAAAPGAKPSAGGYAVTVSAPAKQAQVSASVVAGATSSAAETLTFSGALFGNSPKTVTLSQNNTLAQSIAQINASAIGKQVSAYDDNGKLGLRSLDYGAAQSFSVVSDQFPPENFSGVGTTLQNAVGADVAGTIAGETAKGKGRVLTGNQENGAANGVSVQVTATAPGAYGRVTLQRGAAATLAGQIAQLTDIFTGTIQQEQDALDARIAASQQSVTDISARVDSYIDLMQRQFTRMETQISRFKAQSAQLSQTIAGLNKSNKDS